MRNNKKFIVCVSAIFVVVLILLNILFQNKSQVREGSGAYTTVVAAYQGAEEIDERSGEELHHETA